MTLLPQDTNEFIKQIEMQRRQKSNLQDNTWNVAMSEEYVNELLKYDFTSTKKGRGHRSLLVKRARIRSSSQDKENARASR